MSLFGALDTAISGLNGQSAAFSNISDNVANSQTVGYKRVDTAFIDYLTVSNADINDSGGVVAKPEYINTVQGTITQTDNPLGMAIDGQGYFAVSQALPADGGGATRFSPQTSYTRAGDFQLNNDGYIVNSAGDYLNGWSANASGQIDKTALAPIQVSQATAAPVPTSTIDLSANLPPASGTANTTSTVSVYDAQGNAHQMTLTFAPGTTANTWKLSVTDDSGATVGTATVGFGADGTLASLAQGGATNSTAGTAADMTLATNYPAEGGGKQGIKLSLGSIGQSNGLTQFAGTDFTIRNIQQDGEPPGNFSSISTTAAGEIVANYDNGQSHVIAQVPITTFPAPDALQRQNGSGFTATSASGSPLTQDAGANGAGSFVSGSTEASNVDISSEFSKLIVAQQAYSANSKIVTTASDMLQQTIDMKR